jgi:hypothetical protein
MDPLVAAALLLADSDDEDNELVPPRKKRVWMNPYISRRKRFGYHQNLLAELALENPDLYRNVLGTGKCNNDLPAAI